MKTLRTELFDENQITKLLFRQLFTFQLQLEMKVEQSDWEDLETGELIQAIDRLMEQLMDYYNPET